MPELRTRIFDPASRTEQAANAIRALARMGTADSFALLRSAMAETIYGPTVAAELGCASPTAAALEILRDWLKEHPPSPAERQLLERSSTAEARELLPKAPPAAAPSPANRTVQPAAAGYDRLPPDREPLAGSSGGADTENPRW